MFQHLTKWELFATDTEETKRINTDLKGKNKYSFRLQADTSDHKIIRKNILTTSLSAMASLPWNGDPSQVKQASGDWEQVEFIK